MKVLLYWLLLLVPTVVLGVFGYRLLKQEESQLAETAAATRTERAEIVAENLSLFLEEARGGIVTSLSEMPTGDARAALRAWTEANPFVRQSFVWRPRAGLVFPLDRADSTPLKSFNRRYEKLLAPRQMWGQPGDPVPAGRSLPGDSRERNNDSAELGLTPRQELKQLNDEARIANFALQQAPSAAATADRRERAADAEAMQAKPSRSLAASSYFSPPEPAPRVTSFGWFPFTKQKPFSAVAWVELQPGGEVRGAEVDLEALLLRMVEILPADTDGETYRLLDDGGNIFPGMSPKLPGENTLRLGIGPLLPEWQLIVGFSTPATAAGRSFLLLSSLLLGTLLVSIFSGGSLLLWQAHRHQVDARQKSSFVSNVSHELKTPLTTIRMYAELIGEDRVRDEASKRNYLGIIISESQRLTRLINNVLDFSRLEQESRTPDPQPVDVTARLHEILDAHEIRITAAGLILTCDFPSPNLVARVDPDCLEQAVLNLLDNATKYAADGGELRIAIEQKRETVCVHFLDRGPGVPREQEGRLFQKFFRGDSSLSAKQPGCGLGLNIARRLLKRSGGDLVYQARPGGGACFTIELPASI